jgi:hypothetical protein
LNRPCQVSVCAKPSDGGGDGALSLKGAGVSRGEPHDVGTEDGGKHRSCEDDPPLPVLPGAEVTDAPQAKGSGSEPVALDAARAAFVNPLAPANARVRLGAFRMDWFEGCTLLDMELPPPFVYPMPRAYKKRKR